MAIFIIRHGSTKLNQNNTIQGQRYNFGLSPKGISEIETIISCFNILSIKFDCVISSDLIRATESMKLFEVNNALSNEVKVIVASEIKEIDFGDWDGKEKNTLNVEKFYFNFNTEYPNGESLSLVFKRVESFIKRTDLNGYQNVLVVGHNGVNRMIRAALLSVCPESMVNKDQKHNEIIIIDKNKELTIQI